MNRLTGLTDQPKQTAAVPLADGTRASISLEFRPAQSGWFVGVSYGDFALNGQRLTSSPNWLRQWRDVIPFGLAVVGVNNADPLRQTDLADGTAQIYLLDAADVDAVEAEVYPGN